MAKAPSRLSKALLSVFMKRAVVTAIDDVADGFRLVTLEGAALRGVAWVPGQKIQIAMGSAFVARTFTPIDWDATVGRTRILGYGHGEGPGSVWLRDINIGDDCDLFGPRPSLDTRRLTGNIAMFGDETSIGLGLAFARQNRTGSTSCFYEVNDAATVERMNRALDVSNAIVFERHEDGSHLAQMAGVLPELVRAGMSFVLTGKAATVQQLHRDLKRLGVASNLIATKVHWAPGKTGMD
jgi:NADPH-dependent ferric siderophore reductase